MSINLGNVVGLLRSQTPPVKKYVIWAKILNPSFPDIVELNYWDETTLAWIPVTDPTTNYWLRPVLNILSTPPGTPTQGDRYLIGTAATGVWSGKTDQVATWNGGAWQYQVPLDGFIVSNRNETNKLYDYRGTYGAGGAWYENDFQVPIAPNQYIPYVEKGAINGVATLDGEAKIPVTNIKGITLPFTPQNSGEWSGGTVTIWSALEQLRTLINGINSNPGLYSETLDEIYNNITALLADQSNQTTNFYYWVIDATGDPSVSSGWAIYRKLSTSTAALSDYVKVMEQGVLQIIVDDATPTVKGIMKLYADLTASNTDGTASQAAINAKFSTFVSILNLQNRINTKVLVSGADTYVGNTTPALTAYVTGSTFELYNISPNTIINPTLNIDGLGAKPLVTYKNTPIPVGAFQGSVIVSYDGTSFRMIGGFISSSTVSDTYADIAELILEQVNQVIHERYMVIDASADPAVGSGWAIYQYLGTIAGNLTDYLLIDKSSIVSAYPDLTQDETINGANFFLRLLGLSEFKVGATNINFNPVSFLMELANLWKVAFSEATGFYVIGNRSIQSSTPNYQGGSGITFEAPPATPPSASPVGGVFRWVTLVDGQALSAHMDSDGNLTIE